MSKSLNGFSVEILADMVRPVYKEGYQFFAIPDRQTYKLKLGNQNCARCDATVTIDGEKAGVWRIEPFSTITIERPVNVNRRFTFVKEISPEAYSAGVAVGNYNNGVITVKFDPEKQTRTSWKSPVMHPGINENECYFQDSTLRTTKICSNKQSFSATNNYNTYGNKEFASGATVLGEHSGQKFVDVSPIYDVDIDKATSISLRLVVDDYYTKPYISMREASQYKVKSINEPPRIDDVPPKRPYDDFFVVNRFNPY